MCPSIVSNRKSLSKLHQSLPNPASASKQGVISPSLQGKSVTNILGEVVYSETRNVNSTTSTKLDLSNLNNGIYMLNVQNENSNINKKLIIE